MQQLLVRRLNKNIEQKFMLFAVRHAFSLLSYECIEG